MDGLFVTIDVENDFDAEQLSPSWSDHKNKLVAIGVGVYDGAGNEVDNYVVYPDTYKPTASGRSELDRYLHDDAECFVFHNLQHDIPYIEKFASHIPEFKDFLVRTADKSFWDTQIAEYLLTGQQAKMVSLDKCAVKYGGVLKNPDIKSIYWDKGVKTSEIPRSVLDDYLCGDLDNTAKVFLGQYVKALKQKQVPLIHVISGANVAAATMKMNGLAVNIPTLTSSLEEAEKKMEELEGSIVSGVCFGYDITDPDFMSALEMGSNNILALLKGKPIKVTKKEKIGVYKTGKKVGMPRYKNVVGEFPSLMPGNSGVKDVTEGTIKAAVRSLENSNGYMGSEPWVSLKAKVLRNLLELRKLRKEYKTYLVSASKRVTNISGDIGILHPSLNTCVSNTGRQTSSNPNGQNIPNPPKSTVKNQFVSRHHTGYIVSIDFSQLEVVGLAHITKDPMLNEDIMNGRNVHEMTASGCIDKISFDPRTPDGHKKIKGCVFLTVYGGGPTTLAENLGISFSDATSIQEAFFTRYPWVKSWRDYVYNLVCISPSHVHVSETGRRYDFSGNNLQLPKVANWPVQGFSTGDIVNLSAYKVNRNLLKFDWGKTVRPILQIHDELLFDFKDKDSVITWLPKIEGWMESVTLDLKAIFNIDFKLPLKVHSTVGPSWGQQEEWKSLTSS